MTSRRLDRVAAVEDRRRTQAGSALAQARHDLETYQQQLAETVSRPAPAPSGPAGSAAAMLAERQATGRMVDRMISDALTQNQVVSDAEEAFRHADRRAAQMERAVELALEREAVERRKAEEKKVEDAVIAVSSRRGDGAGTGNSHSGAGGGAVPAAGGAMTIRSMYGGMVQ